MMSICKRLLPGLVGYALITAPVLAEPVKIGASLPITGGLAINGQKHKDGYELCIDLINQAGGLLGEPVEIVISDNQSSNETAQAQFERLINEDDVDVRHRLALRGDRAAGELGGLLQLDLEALVTVGDLEHRRVAGRVPVGLHAARGAGGRGLERPLELAVLALELVGVGGRSGRD